MDPTQSFYPGFNPEASDAQRTRIQIAADSVSRSTNIQPDDAFVADQTWGALPVAPRRFPLPTIAGYTLDRVLGKGGMGVVYSGRQTALDRPVALKMVLSPTQQTTAELLRFRSEAEVVARLQHPHIVGIYELGEHEGMPYFSMELCVGGSLESHWKGPQPFQAAVAMLAKVAAGVAAAHRAGIVHRDLKPGNVFLTADGEPKVADFGLAKRQDIRLTDTGMAVGTPAYMAPEQAFGDQPIGPAADVWALGVILYQAVTGVLPFVGSNAVEVLQRAVSDEPLPPTALRPDCPADLATICLHCLQKEPSRRYADAEGLLAELQRFLAGEPVLARPVTWSERALRWCRRNPVVAGLSGTIAALLVVGTVVASGLAYQAQHAAEQATAEATRARQAEEQAQTAAERAQAAETHLRAIVGRYVKAFASEPVWNAPELDPLRRRMLEEAREYYAKIVTDHADSPDKRQQLTEAYQRLGTIYLALKEFARAADYWHQARAALAEQVAAQPDQKHLLQQLEQAHGNLGYALMGQGQTPAATSEQRAALTIQMALVERYPDDGELRTDLAKGYSNLGYLCQQAHDWVGAQSAYEQAQQHCQRLVEQQPTNYEYQHQAIASRSALGSLAARREQFTVALAHYAAACTAWPALVGRHPTESALLGWATDLGYYAIVLQQLQQPTEAEKQLVLAVSILQQAQRRNPQVEALARKLAHAYEQLSDHWWTHNDRPKAFDERRRALQLWQQQLQLRPADADPRARLCRCALSLDAKYREARQVSAGDVQALEQAFRLVLQTVQARGLPTAPQERHETILTAIALGRLCGMLKRSHEAWPLLTLAEGWLAPLTAAQDRRAGCELYRVRADLLGKLGRHAEAVADWDRASALADGDLRAQFQSARQQAAQRAQEKQP
jgi:serine/threonine-protein kinase